MSLELLVQELGVDFRCDEIYDGLEEEWDGRILQRYYLSVYHQLQGELWSWGICLLTIKNQFYLQNTHQTPLHIAVVILVPHPCLCFTA